MAGVDLESEVEIAEAPNNFKSEVWKHFGFPKTVNEKGEKIIDKTNTICKLCKKLVPYKKKYKQQNKQAYRPAS